MQAPLYKRPKDLMWYLGISAALIGIVVAVFVTGVNWNTFSKWLYTVVSTLFVFWYFVTDSRMLWKNRSFWILTFTLLILHGVTLTIVFEHVEKAKPVLFFCRNLVGIVHLCPIQEHTFSWPFHRLSNKEPWLEQRFQ